MLKSAVLTIVFLGVVLAHHHHDDVDAETLTDPLVTTKQGTLRGVIQTTLFGRQFYSFNGVRYAEAPIDELRFKPPVPVKPWEGTYDATKDGSSCPQPNFPDVAEDCLFANIHTPKLPRKGKNPKYPVIVVVHPGSWTSLTGTSAYFGPQYLLQHDVVLVTFNYRLATLGFLSMGNELAPGNNGLKDQVQMLRWVQENIAAFGGNPNSVTLAGYSAGGIGVSLHMVSPMSRDLFHKVMIMSGSAFGGVLSKTDQFDLAQKQANLVGCPNTTAAEIYDCLKTVPAEDLGNSLDGFRVFGTDPQFIWQMVIEPDFGQERFLIENPHISLQCGRIAKVPVMTGITADELVFLAYPVVENSTWLEVFNRDFNYIAPYAFYYERDTPNSEHISTELKKFYFNDQPINSNSLIPLGELYSDSLSGFAINRGAKILSRFTKSPVYYYIFTYKGRYSTFDPPGGNNKFVVHFDDLLYVFWNSLSFPMFNKTDPEVRTVKKLTKLWANFACTSNPIPYPTSELDWVRWAPSTAHNNRYLDIGNRLVMKRNIYPKRYAEWESLSPLPLPKCRVDSEI